MASYVPDFHGPLDRVSYKLNTVASVDPHVVFEGSHDAVVTAKPTIIAIPLHSPYGFSPYLSAAFWEVTSFRLTPIAASLIQFHEPPEQEG